MDRFKSNFSFTNMSSKYPLRKSIMHIIKYEKEMQTDESLSRFVIQYLQAPDLDSAKQ